jgi:hypothetical protein
MIIVEEGMQLKDRDDNYYEVTHVYKNWVFIDVKGQEIVYTKEFIKDHFYVMK